MVRGNGPWDDYSKGGCRTPNFQGNLSSTNTTIDPKLSESDRL